MQNLPLGGALGGLVSHIALVGGVLFEWRRSSSPRPPRTRGARCADPTKKLERASNTRLLPFALAQEYFGLDCKKKFLCVTAPLQRQHQIVYRVSAAQLEPTRPAWLRICGNDEHIVETFRGAVVIKHVATFRRPAAHIFIRHLGVWRFRLWYPHPRPLFQ